MSSTTAFFVSPADQASEYIADPDKFLAAEFSSIGTLELSTLWCILTGEEWTVELLDEFATLYSKEDDFEELYAAPPAFVELMANLVEPQLSKATAEWAATEELDCSPSDIAPVVEALVRLSREANASGQQLNVYYAM